MTSQMAPDPLSVRTRIERCASPGQCAEKTTQEGGAMDLTLATPDDDNEIRKDAETALDCLIDASPSDSEILTVDS